MHEGRRYRLKFRNASDDIHPLHLHRHSFELTRIGGKPTAGVIKDVVMLGGFQELEFDFVADNPGPTLFHCHQQLHMDFGFMALLQLCEWSGSPKTKSTDDDQPTKPDTTKPAQAAPRLKSFGLLQAWRQLFRRADRAHRIFPRRVRRAAPMDR